MLSCLTTQLSLALYIYMYLAALGISSVFNINRDKFACFSTFFKHENNPIIINLLLFCVLLNNFAEQTRGMFLQTKNIHWKI